MGAVACRPQSNRIDDPAGVRVAQQLPCRLVLPTLPVGCRAWRRAFPLMRGGRCRSRPLGRTADCHEQNPYHDPCHSWPGGRFCRLSLPVSRQLPWTAGRVVTGGMHAEPDPRPRRRNDALSASHQPQPSQGSARIARGTTFAPSAGGAADAPKRQAQASVWTSRSRPHGRRLTSLHSQCSFVPLVSIKLGAFGRPGGAQVPSESRQQSTRFEQYRD